MGRHRPVDFVGWRLYRRALVVPVLALFVLLGTSFRAESPTPSTLPPTLSNEQAAKLLDDAKAFDREFPDRRAGTADANDSAKWMQDRFRDEGLSVKTVTATSVDPRTDRAVPLVNIEATLRGRTRELVVVHAHRDTADAQGRGSDAVGQIALLSLARELASTRDRRRTYLFVSTDGATSNGAGARKLATRLHTRGAVVAVIGLDRVGGTDALRVDAAPSARHAPPLGLVQAASDAVHAEGGDAATGGVPTQLARLATPLTLREHGQLLDRGLPAVTITAADDQLRDNGDVKATAAAIGAGLRSVQRLVGTLDQVDQLQSAGKTWVASERRVYRGWALKIFVASLLVPVWVGAVDMLVRHRRGWNLPAAIGTCVRAMLAGMVAVAVLWLLGGAGLLPGTGDRPPNPGSLQDVRVLTLLLWGVLTTGAWLLARGPDWRRQRRAQARRALGPDTPELVVGLVGLVLVSVLALSVSPYTVLFAVPSLHIWMCIASWQVVFSRRRVLVVWTAGLLGPLLAMLAVGARADIGLTTPWYVLQLVQTRTVPATLSLLLGAAGGLAGLLLLAALGRVSQPLLPVLRGHVAALRHGDSRVRDLLPRPVVEAARDTVRGGVRRLRVPVRAKPTPTRTSRSSRSAPTPTPTSSPAARARARAEARRRVES